MSIFNINRVEDEMEDVTPMFHVTEDSIKKAQVEHKERKERLARVLGWKRQFELLVSREKDLIDLQEQEAKEKEYGYHK